MQWVKFSDYVDDTSAKDDIREDEFYLNTDNLLFIKAVRNPLTKFPKTMLTFVGGLQILIDYEPEEVMAEIERKVKC